MYIDLILIISANLFASYIVFSKKLRSKTYSNHLSDVKQLHNTYYIMRHGYSIANELHIISSDPDIATIAHGLNDYGRQQVNHTCYNILHNNNEVYNDIINNTDNVIIYTSDFLRGI